MQGKREQMEEQMSLFDMGGLADDGAMRDPVSDNDVPPGSMASEVRDDVPAMLSEGEYIVPADVVRYYGVKFFEDLRSQAKSGLMDMERNGRIGGEPVPGPGMEEELSPEEMAMLAEITGMYAGGDVRRPERESISVDEVLAGNMSIYDAINSPFGVYTPEGQLATTPEMKRELFQRLGLIQVAEASGMYGGGMVRKGYTNGGLEDGQPGVAQMTQEDFMNQAQQASGFQLPSSIFTPPAPTTAPATTAATTPITLYGPTGDVIVLMLPTDQTRYNELLSQGYTTEPRPQVSVQTESDGGDNSGADAGEPGGGGFSLSAENREALSNDPLSFGMKSLGVEMPFGADTGDVARLGMIAGGPAGALAGGIVGAAMELDNIAKAQAGLQVAAARGLDDTPEYAALQTAVNTAKENLSGPGKFLSNVLGFGSGKNYAASVEDLAPPAPTTTTTTPAPTDGGGGRPVTPARTPAPEKDIVTFTSEGTVQGSGQAARPGSRPAPERASAEDVAARVSADSRAAAQKAAEELGVSMATRGRATGGLVARPSRKKPVAKKK